ncbi:MAG: Fe/S biogenesis protein NfuA [Alphaproteobacteria bacterium MarineAlpha3_Bin5]|nr:NifU family protein [Magnetovibrio sp.]PPR78994.1 MAG: Fe/S biogenesis protein NfuA [Alphaproteobacteria bacterium MarineAlpha3_Bin5]
MFIQTEATPNPATLKFIPGGQVMPSGTANFDNPGSSSESPIAEALFLIEGVKRVFLGSDFITVSKASNVEWDILKPRILGAIMGHYQSGRPIINDVVGDATSESGDEITRQIIELIDTRVRPAVAQDGGDIVFKLFDEGVVYLEMRGACSGCPSSTATLKHGIERMLQHYIPEVREVRPYE